LEKTDKIQIVKVSEIRTQAKYRIVDVSFLEEGEPNQKEDQSHRIRQQD